MGIIVGIVAFLFVIASILLSIIILLQDSKGEGLASSAFGGEGMQAMLGGREPRLSSPNSPRGSLSDLW